MMDDTLLDVSTGKPVESSHRKFLMRDKSQYVDKTLIIRDILQFDNWRNAFLISQPRGFGKSLSLSSVYYFCHHRFKNSTELFSGLKIMEQNLFLDRLREEYMSKFPVVWIDFGTMKFKTFTENLGEISRIVSNIFRGHEYLLKANKPLSLDATLFRKIVDRQAEPLFLERSIDYLIRWIRDDAKTRPIILIDNFDVPFQTGYEYNFFPDIANFMWRFLLSFTHDCTMAWKVILTATTAILEPHPVSDKLLEKIRDTLHLQTILYYNMFREHYGFTDQEVEDLLQRSKTQVSFQTLNARYGGYVPGNQSLFSPVSVINDIFSGKSYQQTDIEPNMLFESVLVDHGLYPLLNVQQLLTGEPVEKELLKSIHYPSLNDSEASYWSYLVHSGYLTATRIVGNDSRTDYIRPKPKWLLRIPNLEARRIIESTIQAHSKKIPDYNSFIDNMRNGNSKEAKAFIEAYVNRPGKYFVFPGRNHWEENSDIKYVRNYVVQMLQGLRVRYNMTLKETEKSDGQKIEIVSPEGEVLPTSVVIQRLTTLFGTKRLEQIISKFCAALLPLGRFSNAKAEIIIIYKSGMITSVCINYVP